MKDSLEKRYKVLRQKSEVRKLPSGTTLRLFEIHKQRQKGLEKSLPARPTANKVETVFYRDPYRDIGKQGSQILKELYSEHKFPELH